MHKFGRWPWVLNVVQVVVFSFDFAEIPRVAPSDNGLPVFEFYGQPDVACIAGVLWSPDVGHEDKVVAIRQDIG